MRILVIFALLLPSLTFAQMQADSLAKKGVDPWFLGVGVGTSIDKTSEDEAHTASAQLVGGWNFHELAGVGAGLGIHDAYYDFEQFQFMPVFLHLRGRTPGKIGLIGFVNTGYSFPLTKDIEEEFFRREFKGGWLWHTGGGVRIRVKEADLQVTVNYRSFQTSILAQNIWENQVSWESLNERRFNRVELMIALEI